MPALGARLRIGAGAAVDLGACGSYREVVTCKNEEPASVPSVPTVAFSKYVFRPEFKDAFQVQRFERQLRNQHRMPCATIIAHGSPSGMAPRWQVVVDRGGVRST